MAEMGKSQFLVVNRREIFPECGIRDSSSTLCLSSKSIFSRLAFAVIPKSYIHPNVILKKTSTLRIYISPLYSGHVADVIFGE